MLLEWKIGDVKITSIHELRVSGDNEFVLPDASNAECKKIGWLEPHFMDSDGYLIFVVQAFIVDTGSRKIVVDTCIGNDKETGVEPWDNMQTSFLEDMAAAGYPAEEIDTVMCTHLHVDHVGWNTRLVDGKWIPTFPNARYLAARSEWEFWSEHEDEHGFDLVRKQSIQPVVDAGLLDLVEWDHEVTPEVHLEPTPGHTPGHVSVVVESNGAKAIITGDCIHHPVQLTRPEWCSSADNDPEHALNTRKSLIEKYVDSGAVFIGSHFPAPTGGRIRPLEGEKGRYWLDCS